MNLLFTLSSVLLIGAELTVASAAFAQALPPPVAEKIQAAQRQVKTIGRKTTVSGTILSPKLLRHHAIEADRLCAVGSTAPCSINGS